MEKQVKYPINRYRKNSNTHIGFIFRNAVEVVMDMDIYPELVVKPS